MSGLVNMVSNAISGVGNAVGSLFSNKQPDPQVAAAPLPTPAVEAPPVMPLPDDKAVLMQQRKSLAALVKSRGRASTILTADGSLGAPPQALGG